MQQKSSNTTGFINHDKFTCENIIILDDTVYEAQLVSSPCYCFELSHTNVEI